MAEHKGELRVVAHDPQWVTRYREEALTLQSLFGKDARAIHHIGSTAVPELSAKPIIDILLEVCDITRVDQYNEAMRQMGYTPRGEYGLPRRRYFPRIEHGQHLSHVHTWQSGDPEIERHLSFRDYLVANSEQRQAYGRLKQDLAARFAHDRQRYMDGKHQFCQETERLALAWCRAIGDEAILAERLRLLPLNSAQLWHRLARPQQLKAALHVDFSQVSLTAPVRRAIRTKMRDLDGLAAQSTLWHTYWLVLVRDPALAIGLIGFKGSPDLSGTVEIGYGIDPDARGLGYATEAVRALRDWALAQQACRVVVACTLKDNAASIRVLEKSGFSLVQESSEEYCWMSMGSDG